ncbi:hypothetical protein [Cupriavidus pauculus]|uniref:Uncharacterized protein n=1 Tax=Cupriavidus pauculus TaxID=82633 RepID=A0A2N5C3X7_9BURK|nr:hypothetical protein [Cupriavidus pauculus]PLP96929.1 hypothetical protein CYJ10_29235 [Cupriavidus pauculus]
MSAICKHASGGCDYPAGECSGACMARPAPTAYQIGLLQHTLGISEWQRESRRNHFVAGRGHHDMADLEKLESAGLMIRGHRPTFLPEDDVVFYTTEAGRLLAFTSLPEPRKPSRYEEYLNADGCAGDSFAEFLIGSRVPKFETRTRYDCFPKQWTGGDRFGYQYRMYRTVGDGWRDRRDVEGEWRKTKKEAKASYKAALKEHQQRQREYGRAYA